METKREKKKNFYLCVNAIFFNSESTKQWRNAFKMQEKIIKNSTTSIKPKIITKSQQPKSCLLYCICVTNKKKTNENENQLCL